jgi:hypothetical protein
LFRKGNKKGEITENEQTSSMEDWSS